MVGWVSGWRGERVIIMPDGIQVNRGLLVDFTYDNT